MKALDGLRAGKTPRQIAVDIYGADEVAAEWYSDGGMRSQVRRWIDKASGPGGRRLARPGAAPWARRVTAFGRRAGLSDGSGTGGEDWEDCKFVKELDGQREDKAAREVAEVIFGPAVEAEWRCDGGMRSQVRRQIATARARNGGGRRDLVTP